MLTVVKINKHGTARVLMGNVGMTFIVNRFTTGPTGRVTAHVRDYRYPGDHAPFRVWSIGPEGYEIVME